MFREGVETVVIAFILAMLIRTFIVQAFFIPSSSMEDTLLIDDHILVNKFLYRFRAPSPHDIVVFRFPKEPERDFIKRIIGVPGDRIQVVEGRVLRNGQPTVEPFAVFRGPEQQFNKKNYGPVTIPRRGETIELAKLNEDERLIFQELQRLQGRDLQWLGNVFYLDRRPVTTVPVEADYYFVMGDNRDNSSDSRFWGFLASDHILGQAFFIYWPPSRLGSVE